MKKGWERIGKMKKMGREKEKMKEKMKEVGKYWENKKRGLGKIRK